MSTRRRTGLVLGLAVVLVAAFAAHLLHQESLRRAAAIESAIQNGPLTISVSVGGFRGGWVLEVDAAGNATLKIHSFPPRAQKTRTFAVPKKQVTELRKVLLQERFFDLADSYGNRFVDDGGSTTLEVDAGQLSKTVTLYDLGGSTRDAREQLREPSRALRVLQVVLAWFDDPDLNEMRKWNRQEIDAAGK